MQFYLPFHGFTHQHFEVKIYFVYTVIYTVMKIFQMPQVSYPPQGFAGVNNFLKTLREKLLNEACMKNHATYQKWC